VRTKPTMGDGFSYSLFSFAQTYPLGSKNSRIIMRLFFDPRVGKPEPF